VDVAGRVVLITGAARGLGFEVARQLANAGARVVVTARQQRSARDAAAKLSCAGAVSALQVDLDVSDPDACAATAAAIGAEPGCLDILINNAAAYIDWSETASSAELKLAEQVIATNLFGAWRLTQALLPLLRESQHPRIVNVSSGAGSHADPQFGLTRRRGAAATYGISKAALNALTSTLAAELSNTAILVNSVCPGLTATWPGAEQLGARPIPDGAASIAWAAAIPDDGPTGGFFRDAKPLGW
jgi:NAD(P)-dependent dehydrogenase (short-subunit alcohol dehydrogenase family)